MVLSWLRERPDLSKGILLGIGVTGVLIYHSNAIVNTVKSARLMRSLKMASREIYIVNNKEGWSKVSSLLLKEARLVGAVGFDCEWVQVKGKRRPVALVQLASCSGTCVLVRLSQMKSDIPESLKEFLADKSILKVGVGPVEDSNYLTMDYNMEVNGCVDLRHLASLFHKLASEKIPREMGLNALAQRYLEQTLDKDWRVRASNWEADEYTQRQKEYAAEDALVGVHILMSLMRRLWILQSKVIPFLPSSLWYNHLSSAVHQTCFPFMDCKFSQQKMEHNGGSNPSASRASSLKLKPMSRAFSTRKSPLYHNCQMWAPDDQPLCVCDPKKAGYYLKKGLAEIVTEDPLVIRLNFEPAGRPQVEIFDERFYLQERQNICVACGKDQSCIRKNVVPHEYRKHFPDVLKSHQSHDVVLLCVDCKRVSNLHEQSLRQQLAKEFNAAIGTDQDIKVTIDRKLSYARNAAWALINNKENIPKKRVSELENIIKEHFKLEFLSPEFVADVAKMEIRIWNDDYQSHGRKVYEAYEKIGLVKLEQRWRQHFLSSMKPKFLPDGWSVTHNVYRMQLKAGSFPAGHPEHTKYKIALVGTEGVLDIPFNPHDKSSNSLSDESSQSSSRETSPENMQSQLSFSEIVEEI